MAAPTPEQMDAAVREQWEADRRAVVSKLSSLESDISSVLGDLDDCHIIGPDDRAASDLAQAVDDLLDRASRFTVEQAFDDSMPPEDQPLGKAQS